MRTIESVHDQGRGVQVKTDDPSIPAGIDLPAVSRWIAESVDRAEPPFRFSVISGGRSNLTFRVEDANGYMMAMRRPPLGRVLESAHDMGREFRVISAIGQTEVPVPEALALCTDHSVNGADFYLMAFIEGLVPHDASAGAAIPQTERQPLSQDAVKVLADLHSVDPDEVGLGDLGRRDDYVGR
ncbi:MAG TPA: phosphotransferase family protein, partial [Actinobacteria bacterium]|nr:phosphotransferase family protein [Actinomycetota bacterium]